jgi:hypothetical protein
MLMAARESEIEVFGKKADALFGDSDDLREIAMTLDEANIDENKLDRWRIKARGLVRRHCHVIAEVAAALLRHHSLDAKQIDEIVAASGVRLAERIDPASVTFEERVTRHQAWAGDNSLVAPDRETPKPK